MFGSNRYITKGINHELPMDLTIFLWSRVDALKLESDGDMDYLQVFELKELTDPEVKANQLVIHRTEQPEYLRTHAITVVICRIKPSFFPTQFRFRYTTAE